MVISHVRIAHDPSSSTQSSPIFSLSHRLPPNLLRSRYYDVQYFNGSANVSSLYAPATINSIMQYCPTTLCVTIIWNSPATTAESAHALFATTTVHVTSFSSSASVLADPVSNGPSTKDTTTPKETTPKTAATPSTTPVTTTPQQTTTPNSATALMSSEESSSPVKPDSVSTDRSQSSIASTSIPAVSGSPQSSSPVAAGQSSEHAQTTHARHTHHRVTKTRTVTSSPLRSVSTLTVTTTKIQTLSLNAPPIQVGSAIITPNSNTEYLIFSETLSPGGPPITVFGTRYSLATGASILIEGTQTETLATKTGLGGYIWEGIGGSPTTSSMFGLASSSDVSSAAPSVAPAQTGSATTRRVELTMMLLCIMFIVILVL